MLRIMEAPVKYNKLSLPLLLGSKECNQKKGVKRRAVPIKKQSQYKSSGISKKGSAIILLK